MMWGNRTLGDCRANLARYDALLADRFAQGIEPYIVQDRRLGWRMQPDATHPRWPYTTNELANRRSWPDAFEDLAPQRHVAFIGNSHVHGDESPDEETWVYQTQTRLGSDWRVHNLGVTAYATDQAVLRFLEFSQEHPIDLAVLAITTTEIYRNLNLCRALMGEDRELPLFKPRFVDDGGSLRLLDVAAKGGRPLAVELDDPDVLACLRRHDAFYPSFATQARDICRRMHLRLPNIYQRLYPRALSLTLSICRHFVASCGERGIQPAIMFLPVFWGSFPAGAEYYRLAHDLADEVAIIDARTVFTPERLQLPRNALHHRANHFTAQSAGWVADYVAERLQDASCVRR